MKFQQIIFDRDAEDVRLALVDLQQQSAQLRTVEDGADEGHYILADLQGVDPEGVPLVGRTSENQYLHLTSDGPMAGENLQRLKGARSGDQRRITLPGENGVPAHFDVTVKQVSEQLLPDLDDDFAKQVEPGLESLADLEASLGNKIQASFDRETTKRLTRDIADHFVRQSKMEVPSSMIDTYIDNLIEDLHRQGYPEESIEREQVVAEHQATVIWNIKWYLLRRRLIEEEEIEIDDEALDARIAEMAEAEGAQAQQIRNYYKRPENRRALREDLVSDGLMARLQSYAKLKEIHKPSKELRKVSQ
jgi:trigger factor